MKNSGLIIISFLSVTTRIVLIPNIKLAVSPVNSIWQITNSQMDTIKRPFQIKVTNVDEIRMGSPYNRCDIELVGFYKTKLSKEGWQDKYAWSDDSKKLVLIKWDFENSKPGFHLFCIDAETGQTKESPRFFGLPNNISFIADKIKINKFLYDKEKSKPGDLCCNLDEIFDFFK
jgi:hypothetical protein